MYKRGKNMVPVTSWAQLSGAALSLCMALAMLLLHSFLKAGMCGPLADNFCPCRSILKREAGGRESQMLLKNNISNQVEKNYFSLQNRDYDHFVLSSVILALLITFSRESQVSYPLILSQRAQLENRLQYEVGWKLIPTCLSQICPMASSGCSISTMALSPAFPLTPHPSTHTHHKYKQCKISIHVEFKSDKRNLWDQINNLIHVLFCWINGIWISVCKIP